MYLVYDLFLLNLELIDINKKNLNNNEIFNTINNFN